MKSTMFLVVTSICLQSCTSMSEQEMKQLVYLSPGDLTCFSQLRQQLLTDSAALRKQAIETEPAIFRREWMHTNSYYLNKIDSVKYAACFSKLKDKLADDIMVSNKGGVIFTIKRNTERHFNGYNNTYYHDIISADCEYPIKKGFAMIDEVYVDSMINKSWRYASYRALTGH